MKQPGRYIIYLFLLLFSALSQAQTNENNIDARKRAVDYFHLESISLQGPERYDEAYEMLEYCYALDSASTSVQYFLSPYYRILGKDSVACKMLERIVWKSPDNEAYNEALSALVMLGFQKGASEKVLKKIFKENPDLRVEEAIRIALKQL